jgi:glyoxylase-like metal-dependent hydrolase (beta-lactamase superfamily II)
MGGNKMGALKESYRFNIGHFECLVINDGMLWIPGIENLNLPSQYYIQPEQISTVLCLFIRTGEHSILIDTGCGAGQHSGVGKLLQNLQTEGIKCAEIDTVILSHGHGDHTGGNTDAEGRPVFPNARYIMCKEEWESWTSDPNLTHIDVEEDVRQMFIKEVQKNLIPIKDQLDLIDGDTEIMPGIELIRAPGHTPGSIVMVMSSGTEQLLGAFDIFHQPLEIERPDLYDTFDISIEQASRTRIQILSRFGTTNPLVFASHFPFPGLGHIVPRGDAWSWQPIEIKDKT